MQYQLLRHIAFAGVLCVSMVLGLSLTATAQTTITLPPPPPGVIIDPWGYYTWNNPAAAASLGADKSVSGSWLFWTSIGNPFVTEDDYHRLISDAAAYLFIADDATEIEVGVDDGQWVQFPAVDVAKQTGGWIWENADEEFPVRIEFRMRLVRDVLKWEYRIKNLSPYTRRFGYRVLENVIFPPNEPNPLTTGSGTVPQKLADENPYHFPQGKSTNITVEYKGASIPTEWAVRYPGTPGVDLNYRPYWKGRQPLYDGVTRPSRVVFANWQDLEDYTWEEITEAELPENAGELWPLPLGDYLGTDSGVGLYYPILSLGPAQTRVITGEVQMNWAQVSTQGQYALAVYGPEWLGYRAGDDPLTPDTTENGYYAPSYAEIHAWVCNSSLVDDPRVSVTIDPGPGLALDAGQSPSYNNFRLNGLQDYRVSPSAQDAYSWRLVPTGTAFGLIPVRVTASFSLGGSVTSVIYVNVPALPTRTLSYHTTPGQAITRHLIGFPFSFANADARTALGLGNNVMLASYDPVTAQYRYAANDGVALEPGRAYWLGVMTSTPLSLQGATPIDQRTPYRVSLQRGWNLVSNPFQYSIEWGKCRVYANDTEYSFDDAIRRGLVRTELWAWDAENNRYNLPGNPGYTSGAPINPQPLSLPSTELKPYQGYWLFAGDAVWLTYMPEPFLPVMNPDMPGARTQRSVGTLDNWLVNLQVQAGEAKDSVNVFGVRTGEVNGPSAGDLMEPPMSPTGLSAYFPRRDWGRSAGNYAVDLQAPGGVKSWSFEVTCTTPNTQVQVRWPDLTGTPAGLPLLLIDEDGGQQVWMRTTSGYTYASGQGGTRRFTIRAGGAQERLAFTQVQLATTKGPQTAVAVATSMPATVTMRLRTPTGRLVRTISPGRATSDGMTITWDGRDARGRRMPGGAYLCELYAETADGQKARATLTVQVK